MLLPFFLSVLLLFSLPSVYGQVLLPPQNLRAELVEEKEQYLVKLTWARPSPGDTLTYGYYLFNNYPPDEKLYLNGRINLFTENEVVFSVSRVYSANYRFAVQAISSFQYKLESELSEIVEVKVPSIKLPFVKDLSVKNYGDRLVLNWTYDKIQDLKQFQIWVNGKPTDTFVPASSRSFELKIKPNEPIKFIQMNAVTEFDVESGLNSKVFVLD